jgi:hypothetical protein
MPTAKQSKILIETGQTLNDQAVMTDSGDHQIFTISGGPLWSDKEGFAPDVRPNGIISGRNLLSPGTTNDTVKVAAFTAYSKGVENSPSATNATAPRATTAGYMKITSITMASDGSIDKVSGTEGAAFSETRNAAGGPPYIGVNDVEIGQLRLTGGTGETVTTDMIKQVVGTHTERYDYPTWIEHNIGDGEAAESSAEKYAHVKFDAVLPLDHTAGVAKNTFMSYYAPTFSEVNRALDFVPADYTHTVSSQEYYRGSIASVSEAVGQASFTALLNDGLTDSIVIEKNKTITVKQFPDENKSAYSLTQGRIALGRTFPYDNQIQAEVTVSPEVPTAEFAS